MSSVTTSIDYCTHREPQLQITLGLDFWVCASAVVEHCSSRIFSLQSAIDAHYYSFTIAHLHHHVDA